MPATWQQRPEAESLHIISLTHSYGKENRREHCRWFARFDFCTSCRQLMSSRNTAVYRYHGLLRRYIIVGHFLIHLALSTSTWWLEFNVPIQHKYGYIRDKRSGAVSYPYPTLVDKFSIFHIYRWAFLVPRESHRRTVNWSQTAFRGIWILE